MFKAVLISLLMLSAILFPLSTSAQGSVPNSQQISVSPNPVAVTQPDGSVLQIVGKGTMQVPYSETLDGYTLVKNKQLIYEYAVQGKDGNLVPSGLKAKDPADRSEKDRKRLSRIPKHLRYQPPYLQDYLKRTPHP